MRFNVVTGMPRSGSTLLCNILNQNPALHASSTSPLPQTLATIGHQWSNAPEVTSLAIRDREATNARMERAMRALIEAWYGPLTHRHAIFDKARGWAMNSLMLKQLYPEALILCTVRDLRSIFGSVEKQHQRNPVLDHAQNPLGKSLYNRADEMFSPQGLIGAPLAGVEDMARRKPDNLVFVQYEAFARHPGVVLDQVYQRLGLAPFEHDYDNVENVSDDVDELYLGKFEHRGEGKVEPVDSEEWKRYVSADIGALIMQRYPFYNQTFGYA